MSENTSIVKASSGLDELQRTASLLVASGYFDAKGDRNTQIAQLAVKIMAGQELGFTPFASAQGIHIIQGKPQISANLMAAAVKAHPRYDYKVVKMADDGVILRFFENGQPIGDSAFTAEDARRAGTQNMQKFPRNMLFARAMSNGVRWYCPDVFSGQSVYVEGELIDEPEPAPTVIVVDVATGEVIEPSQAPATSTPQPQPVTEPPSPFDDDGAGHNAISQTEPITAGQLKALHGYGMKAYGSKASWDAKRKEFVLKMTHNAHESSKFLSRSEADRLIAGLKKKIGGTLSDDELTELAEIAGYAPEPEELATVPEMAH